MPAGPRKRIRVVRVGKDRYAVIPIRTRYWRPGCNYMELIVRVLRRMGVRDGDILVISEKALAVAKGNIVDESSVSPSLLSKFLARVWMRLVWGYVLGKISRLSPRTIMYLRRYPVEYGSRHKQVALKYAGILGSLCFGSEGGIDGSNLPYAYVCLPLSQADREAGAIRENIRDALGVDVSVMIVDSDRCYTWRNICVTPRPTAVEGIHSGGGVVTYVFCNLLRLRSWPTPVAYAGRRMRIEDMLKVARVADKSRGHGAGRNVWEMAERFGVPLAGVNWEMLDAVPHRPIVVALNISKRRRAS